MKDMTEGKRLKALAVLAGAMLVAGHAMAVPSFARQTGWACAQCHTIPPELTPLGRSFKLHGYNLAADEDAATGEGKATAPLSAMFIADDTWLRRQPPIAPGSVADGADNRGTLRFPDQIALFYAGPVAGQLGAFVQFTYSGPMGAIGFDHTDVRFARTVKLVGQDVILGLDANNTPGAQDAWSTISSCNLPFQPASIPPMPAAWPGLLQLAPNVGSVGAYIYAADLLYAEATLYRTASQGSPAMTSIQGYAPYWRVALTHEIGSLSIELGGYGLQAKEYPLGADLSGPHDRVTDAAVDTQVQWIGDAHIVTVAGSMIGERVTPDASYALGMAANQRDALRQTRIELAYSFARRVGLSVWVLTDAGTADALRYAPAAADGSANGSPNSQGIAYELNVLPWENLKLVARYTQWKQFNGDTVNYDGAGRNAADNDTLSAEAHLMF